MLWYNYQWIIPQIVTRSEGALVLLLQIRAPPPTQLSALICSTLFSFVNLWIDKWMSLVNCTNKNSYTLFQIKDTFYKPSKDFYEDWRFWNWREKFLELWLLWNFNDFVFETFPRAIKTNKLHHISRVMDWNKNILQNYFTIEIYLHMFPRPISNLAILYFSISEVPNFVFVMRT